MENYSSAPRLYLENKLKYTIKNCFCQRYFSEKSAFFAKSTVFRRIRPLLPRTLFSISPVFRPPFFTGEKDLSPRFSRFYVIDTDNRGVV